MPMALVVFLKGVNVGGHRRFRPSVLAQELKRFDVVNIGATGTFVVRKPVGQSTLRAEIARRLPFDAEVMICDGRDILRATDDDPFVGQRVRPDIIRFVSVLATPGAPSSPVPPAIPPNGRWYVKVLAHRDRFVFGIHRREMKAIGYLGQLEKLFGCPVTTRSWSTILSIARILQPESTPERESRVRVTGPGEP
jgi:uncharacterized protein (DUF1697 family)